MAIDPENGLAQITARAGMARAGTARVGAHGKRWELRDGDPFSESMTVCHRETCVATVTGIIGDGSGPATGIGGANGFAVLCGAVNTTPVQADGSGNYTIAEEVPCGDYTLVLYSELDQAYREEPVTLITGINDVSTLNLNTLGAHNPCP